MPPKRKGDHYAPEGAKAPAPKRQRGGGRGGGRRGRPPKSGAAPGNNANNSTTSSSPAPKKPTTKDETIQKRGLAKTGSDLVAHAQAFVDSLGAGWSGEIEFTFKTRKPRDEKSGEKEKGEGEEKKKKGEKYTGPARPIEELRKLSVSEMTAEEARLRLDDDMEGYHVKAAEDEGEKEAVGKEGAAKLEVVEGGKAKGGKKEEEVKNAKAEKKEGAKPLDDEDFLKELEEFENGAWA